MVKVHSLKRGSEAHLVTAVDWADADGYRQSPNGESGNLFNASFLVRAVCSSAGLRMILCIVVSGMLVCDAPAASLD